MLRHVFILCAIVGTLLTTRPAEANPRSTADLKNNYRTELTAYLDSQETLPTRPLITDEFDKIFTQILGNTVDPSTTMIEATPNVLPHLYEDLVVFCGKNNMNMPRVYIALSDDIDAKFCTYDLSGALLIGRGTFEVFSTRVFRGYLQQVLLRMRRRFDNHKKLSVAENSMRYVTLGVAVALNIGAFVLGQTIGTDWGWKKSALQTALAGTSGAALCYIFQRRFSTHSYERIASFHNQEMAREDIFPGQSPDESLAPTYNPSPHHAMHVITATQAFIRERDREFAELENSEDTA